MRPARAVLLLLAFSPAWAACDDDEPDGIDRSDFVAAFVDLRAATVQGTLDSLVRDSILDAHGLTEADLRAYIQARSDDPDALSETWREVLDSIAARDSAAALPDSAAATPDTN